MALLASIISMTFLAVATSSSFAFPTTSCQDDICTDGHRPFECSRRGLVCCKGATNNSFQVFTKRPNFECCAGAGMQYDIQSEICVNGQIRSRRPNEKNCGPDKTFDETNQVCCRSNVFSIVAGGKCCGDEYLADDDTQSCCNGNVKYNTNEQACCKRRESDPVLGTHQLFNISHGKCCLEKPYNAKHEECVETVNGYEVTVRENRDMPICSGESYDPDTHGCCRGESTMVYERRRMLCYHGRLHEKSHSSQNALCVYNYIDDEGTPQRKEILYKTSPRTRCISTRGVVTLGPSEDICGDEIYNSSTDLCCTGKLHGNMKIEGFKCCMKGGTKIFNPEREICCLNEVSKKMSYDTGARCCHKEAYNETTHKCHGGKVTVKPCPSYGNKCNATAPILERMKKHYVYFGIAGEMTEDRPGRRSVVRQWTLSDMKTLKFKRGKATVVKVKSKATYFLKSTECGCPEKLEVGARYMFVSSQPVRRKSLSLESVNNGFVIPIEDKKQIGLVFETIIKKSK